MYPDDLSPQGVLRLMTLSIRSLATERRLADARRLAFLGLLALAGFFAMVSALDAQTLGPADGHDLAATDLERVTVGDEAPLFTLDSFDSGPVDLAGFRGEKNVVLVFYRGHW